MNNLPNPTDLYIFLQVLQTHSFNKTANKLGVSAAYVTKRIQVLEKTLNCKLLHRSTRSITPTDDGKTVQDLATQILDDMNRLSERLSSHVNNPSGSLLITSSVGFGRNHIAPVLSDFTREYPNITIRFNTVDTILDLIEQQIDVDIRIGNNIAPNLIAKKLLKNKRILCASPEYLAQHGTPAQLSDLLDHQCLIIKERDYPFGIWELNSTHGVINIKVGGTLSSNNGEIVRDWALAGWGIMLRSLWDVMEDLRSGKLVQLLPDYWQDADIWAVYPNRLSHSAKLRVFVDFLEQRLCERLQDINSFY